MINRRVTRTIFKGIEVTRETQSPAGDSTPFNLITGDFFYMGFYAPFQSRHLQFRNLNTTKRVVTVEYWNGTAWTGVTDLVDQTVGMTRNGFLSWVNETDWATTTVTPIDDVNLYYVRVSIDLDLDPTTSMESVLNLYSDDDSLRAYYPELVSDSRYLPVDRTNFLEQHVSAKELVVLRLKQRKLIKDEKQILDINEVHVAAVHAAAYLILHPIATSDAIIDLAQRALNAFEREVAELSLSVDQNEDGTVSEAERSDFGETFVARR